MISQLILELWQESKNRCPYVNYNKNEKVCFCSVVDKESSQLVCDYASLQLWCLNSKQYPLCIYYQNHVALQSNKITVE